MKKTLIYFCIVICVLAIPVSMWYFFEYKQEQKITEISTFEELKAVRDGKVKLTNDIDCGYETISCIVCDEFDGQGYTIKNCVITVDGYNRSASLFAAGTGTIKNVNLEKIVVKGTNGMGAAIVCVANAQRIENVHVKDSKVSCGQCLYGTGYGRTVARSYIGGIYGGYMEKKESFDCEIVNCSVQNVEIEITGYNSTSLYADMFAGGIAGGGNKISNCSAVDCKITAKATSIYGEPYIGGIVGISNGKIENSFSKNCEFTAKATYYQDNFAGMYSTSCAFVGGIAGEITENGNIRYSYSENNKFYVKSSGDLNVGGLVGNLQNGTVAQSYTKGNYIETDGYVKGNKDSVARRVGGLVGLAKDSTISSCFAYNNGAFIEKSEGFKEDNDSKFAGLIAGVSSVSVMNCATYNNNLQSVTTDEFIPFDVGSADSCYVSATTCGNVNGCEIISEEFWFSPNLLQEKLNLMGAYWNLTTGELPCLKISD